MTSQDASFPDVSEVWLGVDMADGKMITLKRDSGARLERGDADAGYQGFDASADVEWMTIAELVLSDSPRSAGEDSEHTQTLAESKSGAELPPIVVQRGTNRVIDGRHRVRAARLRGEEVIRGRFFDGDDASAFVLAVRLNVQHGLPLSLADRKTAARRILREQMAWSNRAIASVAGLSPKTVAALREETGQPAAAARVGRDGRVRPVSTASGRELAKAILIRDPTSSLRAVSAVAGVSPGTVRDVRNQLRQQAGTAVLEPPAPSVATPIRSPGAPAAASQRAVTDRPDALLRSLRSDPSLRLNQSGRLLLSILAVAGMDPPTQERLIVDLPDHCVDFVAELAEASVQAWKEFAIRVAQRRSGAA